ncbi:MAG: hypothetical protein V4543_17410, partial [Bacteroidota bacterium]
MKTISLQGQSISSIPKSYRGLRLVFLMMLIFTASHLRAQTSPPNYTTPGTYNWICPNGVTSVDVKVWGGGGGGGGAHGNTAVSRAGGGGGSGSYAAHSTLTVVPGTTYTIVVGALGAGSPTGASASGNGSDGGASS